MSGVLLTSLITNTSIWSALSEAGLDHRIGVNNTEFQGFRFHSTPGHSIDHASISVTSRGETALFWGDVMHHPLQFRRPEINSAYCEFPKAAQQSRNKAMKLAAELDALVFTTHFGDSSVGKVSQQTHGFDWQLRRPVMKDNATSELLRETYLIDSDTAGIQLQLLRRVRRDKDRASSGTTLMLIHGAIFPCESLFDVPVDGASFMDVLATAGFDVWAVDARGYGGSTRPPEMSAPPIPHHH